MRISRIRIENYRSIGRCEFRATRLCALVGENNAGKSNILTALHTVLGREWVNVNSFTDEDFRDRNSMNDIVIEAEFDPPLTHREFAHAEPVEIPILRWTVTRYKRDTKTAKKGDRRLDAACLKEDGEPVMVLVEAPKRGVQHKLKPLTSIPHEVKKQIPVIFVGTERRLSAQMPSSRYSVLRRLFEDVDQALKTRTVTVLRDGKQEERIAHEVFLEQLGQALKTLRIPEFQQLEDILRVRSLENLGYDPVKDRDRLSFHFDLFDSLDFFKTIKLLFREGSAEIEATQMGEGAQNALVIAIFQAYESLKKKGAVFLIEEPEMYLHPHRQRFFFETLRRLSADNQIIYTTHSPQFVTIPEYEHVRIVFRNAQGNTDARASHLKATAQIREKLRKEFDPERNELFFAKHVILVEGDTEKLALPEYATRLSIDLDREGCSVVEVGGKRSLKAFADIVGSFDIPMTVVFDTDSSDFKKGEEPAEEAYNEVLRSLHSARVSVVELNPRYEAVLRNQIGDLEYERLCQKYPGHSKAIRARLIAADSSGHVPQLAKDVFAAFLKKPVQGQEKKKGVK